MELCINKNVIIYLQTDRQIDVYICIFLKELYCTERIYSVYKDKL